MGGHTCCSVELCEGHGGTRQAGQLCSGNAECVAGTRGVFDRSKQQAIEVGVKSVSLLLTQQGLSESLTEDAEVEEAVELLRLRLPWVRARCFRPFSEDPRRCTRSSWLRKVRLSKLMLMLNHPRLGHRCLARAQTEPERSRPTGYWGKFTSLGGRVKQKQSTRRELRLI
jgi:hypothetical protein